MATASPPASADGLGRATADETAIVYRGVAHTAPKRHVETTHRTCPPEETLERITPVLSSAGITRLADVTGLDRIGIPTILAMRPNAPTLANSSGKGFTLTAAKVSAAMEGIELFCAEEEEHFPFEITRATHDELQAAGLAIPLELLPLAKCSLFHPEVPESWVLGFDIMGQREVAVPYEMVGMGASYSMPQWRRRALTRQNFQPGSNGLASGNAFLEAVCAGLCEVIERDAVTCTTLRCARDLRLLARVDLRTAPFESVQALNERLEARGMMPLLFDCTVDTAVPTYMAYLLDQEIPSSGAFRGYGAHLHPEVAMVRALTEAVQSRCIYIAGSRDDMMTLEHRRLRQRGVSPLVELARAERGRDVSAWRTDATASFEGDCRELLRAVARVGLERVVVLDLTWPELGIPVVRVIVPGLEGYRSFGYYAPGPRGRAAIAAAASADLGGGGGAGDGG